jgi:hypothetical protein
MLGGPPVGQRRLDRELMARGAQLRLSLGQTCPGGSLVGRQRLVLFADNPVPDRPGRQLQGRDHGGRATQADMTGRSCPVRRGAR